MCVCVTVNKCDVNPLQKARSSARISKPVAHNKLQTHTVRDRKYSWQTMTSQTAKHRMLVIDETDEWTPERYTCSAYYADNVNNVILRQTYSNPITHFMAIIQVNLRWSVHLVKNWRILSMQSFTARMPLLMATSAFRLGRRCCSSAQQCYLHCLRTCKHTTNSQQIQNTIINNKQSSTYPHKRLNSHFAHYFP